MTTMTVMMIPFWTEQGQVRPCSTCV